MVRLATRDCVFNIWLHRDWHRGNYEQQDLWKWFFQLVKFKKVVIVVLCPELLCGVSISDYSGYSIYYWWSMDMEGRGRDQFRGPDFIWWACHACTIFVLKHSRNCCKHINFSYDRHKQYCCLAYISYCLEYICTSSWKTISYWQTAVTEVKYKWI